MIDKAKWEQLLKDNSYFNSLSIRELEVLVEQHPYSYTIYLFLLKKMEASNIPVTKKHLAKIGLLTSDPLFTSVSLNTKLEDERIGDSSQSQDMFDLKSPAVLNEYTTELVEESGTSRTESNELDRSIVEPNNLVDMNNQDDKKGKWTPFDKLLNAFFNIGKKNNPKKSPQVNFAAEDVVDTNDKKTTVQNEFTTNEQTKVTVIEETTIESDHKVVESKVYITDKKDDLQVEEISQEGERAILAEDKVDESLQSSIPSNIEDVEVSPLADKVTDLKDAKQLKKEKKKAKKKAQKKKAEKKKEKSKKSKKKSEDKKKKDSKDLKKSKFKKDKKKAKKKDIIEEKIKVSTIRKVGVGSETLANLMIEQGKINEAKKIFQELMVKYPEKSSYFANLIKKLN